MSNRTILLVKVETVSGNVHEFFYDGLIETLQNDINNLVRTCDKFGKPTKVIKSFNPDNIACLTIVEVETDIKVITEVKWYEPKTTRDYSCDDVE
jgi:RPA family protein